MNRPIWRSIRVASFAALAAFAVAACASTSTSLPPARDTASSDKNPGQHALCLPCPTTRPSYSAPPTPSGTPFNGPVGSSNDLNPKSNPPVVLTSATSHVVIVNDDGSMGNQVQFLTNLYGSDFFSYIVDQYVANPGSFNVDQVTHRITITPQSGYLTTLAPLVGSTCPPPSYLYLVGGSTNYECATEVQQTYLDQGQVINAVTALAGKQNGPHNIWSIIVNPEYPLCTQQATLLCWGPSEGEEQECGDHVGGGAMLYTLQQNVADCNTDSEADGISSTLSHETFETITNPDNGGGWTNAAGHEIGDICEGVDHWMWVPYQYDFKVTETWVDIQPEWSNKDAHCYPKVDGTNSIGVGALSAAK